MNIEMLETDILPVYVPPGGSATVTNNSPTTAVNYWSSSGLDHNADGQIAAGGGQQSFTTQPVFVQVAVVNEGDTAQLAVTGVAY